MNYPGEERRICWPNPDATCLEGGCMYCNDYKFRSVDSIWRYCEREYIVYNRGDDQQRDPLDVFKWGHERNWSNAESRTNTNNPGG